MSWLPIRWPTSLPAPGGRPPIRGIILRRRAATRSRTAQPWCVLTLRVSRAGDGSECDSGGSWADRRGAIPARRCAGYGRSAAASRWRWPPRGPTGPAAAASQLHDLLLLGAGDIVDEGDVPVGQVLDLLLALLALVLGDGAFLLVILDHVHGV